MVDFDPRYPPTTNSLNRLRLDAAGIPDDVRSSTGYDLLSSHAVSALIEPYASDALTFHNHAADGADWAIEAAHVLGTRLGYLLFVLTHNDLRTHHANPDKPAGFWAHWSGIQKIVLGGGLIRGIVGQKIASHAQQTLRNLAAKPRFHVIQALYPQYLPLLGLARTVQSGERAAVLDFGGTYVKRGIAHYRDRQVSKLQIKEPLMTRFMEIGDDPGRIFERMVDIIAQSCDGVDATTIPVSIAAYVDQNGQPLLSQAGIYMRLAQYTKDVPAALSQEVSTRLGRTVQVALFHDGTAAALRYVPGRDAVVIMLGTAIGSGYPVPRPGLSLCPVLPALSVEHTPEDDL